MLDNIYICMYAPNHPAHLFSTFMWHTLWNNKMKGCFLSPTSKYVATITTHFIFACIHIFLLIVIQKFKIEEWNVKLVRLRCFIHPSRLGHALQIIYTILTLTFAMYLYYVHEFTFFSKYYMQMPCLLIFLVFIILYSMVRKSW